MSSISNSHNRKAGGRFSPPFFKKMKRKIAIIVSLLVCMLTGCADATKMDTLFPRADESYVGDVMALSDENGIYLNYLYETDHNGVGYHPIHRFYTRDFLIFEDKGEVLPFAQDSEVQDLAVGTGSFIIDDQGNYHCFYTGHNDYYDTYGLDKECVLHAVSKDNKTYTKNYENAIHAPEGYSTTDFRDPQVYRTDNGYLMLVGARKEKENESAIVYYESQDLENWTFKGDFYTSKDLYFMECPDVFSLGDKYYLVFSWNNVVYYRISDNFFGPWDKEEIDTFDGDGFYAAKTCEFKGKRYLVGFLDRKKREKDSLKYTWAGSVLVYELRQLSDGTLGVCMPEQYNDYFKNMLLDEKDPINGGELELGKVPESCHLSLDLNMSDKGRMDLVFSNPESGEEYKLSIDNEDDNLSFNAFPNNQPIKLKSGQQYHIDVVVEKDIVVLYADGKKALSNRIYAAVGADWKIETTDSVAENVMIYGK